MKKYRKKPLAIEAVQLTRNLSDIIVEWIGKENINEYCLGEFREDSCYIEIKTLEGFHLAGEGDYIIKGIKGEFYPCKKDIFKASYEEVEQ